MLLIALIAFLVYVPNSNLITSTMFNRMTTLALIYSSLLSINMIDLDTLGYGIGIYSSLFNVSNITLTFDTFIYLVGAMIMLAYSNQPIKGYHTSASTIPQYSLIVIFTIIGQSLLVSSYDLVSLFISLELQSFGLYILATIYRNSEGATGAGLKYFLLGGLSSSIILLGSALVYSYTGMTQFESLFALCQVVDHDVNAISMGLILITIGLLFKVASAPLHHWAPDVYDGVPTIVTMFLTTMPKISLFIVLMDLFYGFQGSMDGMTLAIAGSTYNVWTMLLLIASTLSLIVGTVGGLNQVRIKRLLSYSTISHVGFILLALAVHTQDSLEGFLFYVIQYSITNLCVFMTILGFSYVMSDKAKVSGNKDLELIEDLSGQYRSNPMLTLSLAICLFSMAGIPPMIGFFGKQMVLYSSMSYGYYFISFIAILVSVISASYYLKVVKVMFYDDDSSSSLVKGFQGESAYNLSNAQSFVIAITTLMVAMFLLNTDILLNSVKLLALSAFTS